MTTKQETAQEGVEESSVTAEPGTATPETATPEATASGEATPGKAVSEQILPDPAAPQAETAVAQEGPGAGRTARGWWGRAVGALAAMLVAAVAATAVLQWITAERLADELTPLRSDRALRLEVSAAAHAFGTALLSYDYRDLPSTRTQVMSLASGDFLRTYDEAFGDAMGQVIIQLKAVSRATVREVYLSELDEATAHAIIVVDQQVNTSSASKSVVDSHLKADMIKEKGVWKVNTVTVLGAASEKETTLNPTVPTPEPTKKN